MLRALVLLLTFAAAHLGLFAQPVPAPQRAEGPVHKVGTVAIKFVGVANISEQVVRANMSLREGIDLDEALIDRDIRTLYRTGLFEFIEVKREARPGNIVNLVVELVPKFRVLSIRFEGNKAYKERRLAKEIKTTQNGSLDERQIKDDSEKIHEFYQKAGYNQAIVTYSVDRDRGTGFGTVTYKIREGAKVKISALKFIGNDHVKSRRLRKEMTTKKWHYFSWLTGGGRFKDDDFEADIDKLRDYYREQGFLDVEIAEDKITFDYPRPSKLVLTIRVNEGRQYKIGKISFTGNKLYPPRILALILRKHPGMVFVPADLDKDVESLEDFYGRDGYLDTRVRLVRKPNLTTGNIDVEYRIEESERFQVESVVIEGNDKTKSIVILRELVLGPGDIFDSVRMKISKARLENTRFFEEQSVNVTPETTNIPGRRNLRVAVREGRTGNLTFGAGFSSLERATLFAEITQSNFDFKNRRSFFQGDGQKFRLRLQLGSQSSEIVLAFEEPWLFERELAFGFQLARTTSDFNSALFEEVRTFAQFTLRKRLFGLIEGTAAYTYQIVDIRNVDPSAPANILSLSGTTTISKLGLSLLRDTRDKIINTTRGNRVELLTEIAGGPLGGSSDYYKLEFRGAQFYPVFEFHEQVLALIARGGVADSYGKTKQVPFFDQFFLGGPQDVRGFDFREVGPKSAFGEPIGGKTYAFFSAEYSFDLVKPIRFAMFYDAGFVNAGSYDFSPARYNDNWGVGLRLFVAGAPLALDFGIPLTTDRFNKQGNQFNFSFGTRF